MFCRPLAQTQGKPIALFFQVKHSGLDVTSRAYPTASILQWYQRSLAALAAFEVQFEVVLVLVTNRVVDSSQLEEAEKLVVIAAAQLATYLGPLAQRGLLAI